MKKVLLVASMVVSGFAFPGMNGGHNGMMGAGSPHNMTPMKGLTDNKIVAEVNGEKVKVKDVNYYIQGMTKDFRIKLQELPAQHVGDFIKKYVNTEVYYPTAKEITKTPQYKALMKKIAVELWITKEYRKIKISNEEAKEFYEKNKNVYFKTTPKLKAKHIVVKDKNLAKKIITILEKTPKTQIESEFVKLAKQYSIGPSKVDGGELGYFNIADMAKPFSEAALKLKKGEFTHSVVQTRFGYHIILLEDKNTKNYVPFNKVKTQIVAYLTNAKLDKKLSEIEKKANVKYFIKIK